MIHEALHQLLQDFDARRIYTEREVNDLLRTRHDDPATLRRYLVDARLLARDAHGTVYSLGGASG